MGKTYFYGKIVSMFGKIKGGKGMNGMMKYMMMSEMMKGNGGNNNSMSSMLPMMMFMNGGMGDMFDGMFDFEEEEERRYKIIFSGVVQGVGFRYEVWLLAEKIGITGFAENLPNGNVLVEAQGPKNKLLYLVEHMRKIPRIYIEDVEIDEIEMKDETCFVPIY